MRRFRHILSFLTVALFLLLAGSVATADTVDPVIGVKGCGAGCTRPWPGSFPLTNIPTNDFTSGGFGLGPSDTITGFLVHSDTPLLFSTDPALFPGETVTQIDSNNAILSGFTIVCGPCIDPPGLTILSPFVFEVINGQGDNLTFSSTPEPGTLILLGTGLSGLGLRRLRRKARA